jgi:hypothetical protein
LNNFVAAGSDLEQTLDRALPLLEAMSDDRAAERPRPEKWSKKEILGHLLDSASNNHQRFVRATLQGELTFPGYSQDELVKLQGFHEMKWGSLIEFWVAYNRFLAAVLQRLPAEAESVQCAIGNNPPATLGWIAQDYVAHLKHHLNQILGQMFETAYGKRD